MIKCFDKLDDKIVIFGQSCVGKTTFASKLLYHHYYCFDAMFHWHDIENFGLSIQSNLKTIKEFCKEDKFVLDGWSLCDKEGVFLPKDAAVYVVYSSYEKIISQYRIEVIDPEEFKMMYEKWYNYVDYTIFGKVRYFLNSGEFTETNRDKFVSVVEESLFLGKNVINELK